MMKKQTKHTITLTSEELAGAVMALLKCKGETQPSVDDEPEFLEIDGALFTADCTFTWYETEEEL